jgi:hypothetical protein
MCTGIIVGAYWLGITRSTGHPENQGEIPPWAELVQVNIVGLLLGSALGGLIGLGAGHLSWYVLRRVVHNSKVAAKREKAPTENRHGPSNKRQRVVLWIGALVVATFIVIPPWMGSTTAIITDEFPEGLPGEPYKFIGFHFLFSSGEDLTWDCVIAKVDYRLLAILCGCTAFATSVSWFLLRTKRGQD